MACCFSDMLEPCNPLPFLPPFNWLIVVYFFGKSGLILLRRYNRTGTEPSTLRSYNEGANKTCTVSWHELDLQSSC